MTELVKYLDDNKVTIRRVAAWVALLGLAWPLQYAVAVPSVYLWRWSVALVKGALKVGVLGVVLLFIPILGWIVLVWLVFFKARTPAPARANVWRPWLIEWTRP